MLLISGATAYRRRCAADEQHARLGHLLNPRSGNSAAYLLSTGMPIAADNDCYQGLNRLAYLAMLRKLRAVPRERLLWVVTPDVVADACLTLARFRIWRPALAYLDLPLAFVAQDGAEQAAHAPPWGSFCCLFIGGSTAWKEGPLAARLVLEARERGVWTHMGRVNTLRRARLASALDVDSIDGSALSRFPNKYIPWMLKRTTYKQHGMEDLLCHS
jgi:hypothetical protein